MTKEQILKKLKAFSQRTVENGCTEAEAVAAAQAMQALQDQYNCTLTELDISLTEYTKDSLSLGKKVKHPVWNALYGVQLFCEVKLVGTGAKLTVFGQQHKVENAMYLISLMQSAMELEYLKFKATADYEEEAFYHHARSIRSSFMNAMASRLCNRLQQMHRESRANVEQPKASNGTALVIVADRALDDAFRKEFPRLRSGGHRHTRNRSAGAARAGRSAGDRVGLRAGVSGNGRNAGLLR